MSECELIKSKNIEEGKSLNCVCVHALLRAVGFWSSEHQAVVPAAQWQVYTFGEAGYIRVILHNTSSADASPSPFHSEFLSTYQTT